MKTQLCRCNNCDTIMIDENPSDQPEFEVPKGALDMVQRFDEPDDINTVFWACPVCLTDDYLMDVWEL